MDRLDTLNMNTIEYPIISVGQFLDKVNGTLCFSRRFVYLKLRGSRHRIKVGVRTPEGLYTTCVPDEELEKHTSAACINELSIHAQVLREKLQHLHRSLGHANSKVMSEVLKNNKISNLKVKDLELLIDCDTCHTGKIRRP